MDKFCEQSPLLIRPGVTQSVTRGVMRLLWSYGFAPLCEVALPDGRRADVLGLSAKGDVWIVEVKSCAEDFKTDAKWSDYIDFCDRLFFAVPAAFPSDLLPDSTGLILADHYAGEIARMPEERRLSGARRNGMLKLAARLAAQRLYAKDDADFVKSINRFET